MLFCTTLKLYHYTKNRTILVWLYARLGKIICNYDCNTYKIFTEFTSLDQDEEVDDDNLLLAHDALEGNSEWMHVYWNVTSGADVFYIKTPIKGFSSLHEYIS